MYTTKIWGDNDLENFDWEAYFSGENPAKIFEGMDLGKLIFNSRNHLKEDKFRMTFVLGRVLRSILRDVTLNKNPRTLELGAATGFLTRWLISQYGGTGVLVDNSKASYQAYSSLKNPFKKYITYLDEDIFSLKLGENFDIVCSFGLMEHFIDKKEVLDVHRRFLAPEGIILILVPLDTPLTRVFWELYPELNRGYRELLT
ncbi:MAG: methyltransferase domain-containing protein, partial [Candidatus Aminicenantes bacterium]